MLSTVCWRPRLCSHVRRRLFIPTDSSLPNRAQLPEFNHQLEFRRTQPPCPAWKLGGGASVPAGEGQRRVWDLKDMPSKDVYRLLTSAIVPRPIAFVSSYSVDGIPNLAPFSYFSMISHNPPMLSVSFSLSPRRPKDTRENILSTKEFTVNIISEGFVEAANSTSVEAPAHVNEWVLSGLTMAPSHDVKPPIVKESAVSFECELYSSQDIANPKMDEITTTVVLGMIKRAHVQESVLAEDGASVDSRKLRPVSRLGGTEYARLLEAFSLARVSWKAHQEEYEQLVGRDMK